MFSESLSEFRFLSELYSADIEDCEMLVEYPSSNSDETQFQNRNKYIIHDPYPPPSLAMLKYLGPHHHMCGWGNKFKISSEVGPSELLIKHWQKYLGSDSAPHWNKYNKNRKYLTIYPHEVIEENKQIYHPKMLHFVHSKKALQNIECPQAEIFSSIHYPCILKFNHGYAGLGNFFIRSETDEIRVLEDMENKWPKADYVINEVIENIVGDYGVQFYLKRNGHFTYLGFTEQIFDLNAKWSGGLFDANKQDNMYETFRPFIEKVSKFLHEEGYFGVVGIDILKNAQGQCYLVDLNPRLTGITPFLIISRLFVADGMTHGIYLPGKTFSMPAASLFKFVETIGNGKIIIQAYYEDMKAAITQAHIAIIANSSDERDLLIHQISDL